MTKASCAADARCFTDIPNVGKATAEDFKQLGLCAPTKLTGGDAYALYRQLCSITGTHHDPCAIDVFLSAIDFMNGAAPQPWWHYTAQRKATLGED